MSMIVLSKSTMCCQDCWFHFLCDDEGIVTHGNQEMYTKTIGRLCVPCPNMGKRFRFPDEKPVEGIELMEEV